MFGKKNKFNPAIYYEKFPEGFDEDAVEYLRMVSDKKIHMYISPCIQGEATEGIKESFRKSCLIENRKRLEERLLKSLQKRTSEGDILLLETPKFEILKEATNTPFDIRKLPWRNITSIMSVNGRLYKSLRDPYSKISEIK